MSKGLGNLLRQAKQMQKKIVEVKEELKSRTYEGSSGQEKVKVTVSGNYELKTISIDSEIVDPDDIGMLEDLIVLAANEALLKARETGEEEIGKLTGGMGLDIPGMF